MPRWASGARALILTLSAALLAAGCGRALPPADALVVAQAAEPRSLDPHVTTALNDFRILANIYQGLVGYRPGTLEPAPALAESWTVSADGRRYTFRLRRGVRFHDGTPFDAEAVRFNFQRMLDPEHPDHGTGPFPLAFFFDAIEQVEVLGPHRVRLRLRAPFAPFLSNLAYPAGYMVSPAAVRRWGDEFGRHPSGTGPFLFVDWRPGERVLLERVEDRAGIVAPEAGADRAAGARAGAAAASCADADARGPASAGGAGLAGEAAAGEGVGEGQPDASRAAGDGPGEAGAVERARSVERLIFRPIGDPMTRVAELMAGGVDAAVELSPDNVQAFRERRGFRVLEATGPHLWFLILNTRDGPFADRRVRLAVNLAIDGEALVDELLLGTAERAAGPIPRAFGWAHDPALAPYPHDPQRARALLAEAGYGAGGGAGGSGGENGGGGPALRFLVPRSGSGMLAPVAMATAIQADLAAVGLEARIDSYEWNAYLARVNDGLDADADLAEMAWMTNDPDTLAHLALRCGATPDQGGFNSGWYCNPAVDRLIERARRSTDRGARARLYRALARVVQADAPWVVVASWRQSLVTRAAVRGVRLEPSFLLRLGQARKAAGGSGGD